MPRVCRRSKCRTATASFPRRRCFLQRRNRVGTDPDRLPLPLTLPPRLGRLDRVWRSMVQCIYCKTKVESCDKGLPSCLDCANRAEAKEPPEEQSIRAILQRELTAATAQAHAATDAFHAIVDDIPSALPHTDGTQRIHNVYRELSIA